MILTLIASLLFAAGTYNETLGVGDPAPAWVNLDGIDGKKHSLADLKDKDVVVVIFTCNSCPVAVAYEDRIVALSRKHKNSKVGIIAINVNQVPEDKLDKMKERAEQKGFDFPYLFDPTQKIAKDFGARFTPEFFVLDKNRKIAYLGAMDNKNAAKDATESYLDAAVDAALRGEKSKVGETLGRGCAIRWIRKRD